MAAMEEDAVSGRRTRSGRNAPVINIGTGRKTRRSATLEEDSEVDTPEVANVAEEAALAKETTRPEAVEDDTEAAAMTTETMEDNRAVVDASDSSNSIVDSSNSPGDQFVDIPDGNGMASNNGIEHMEDAEMREDAVVSEITQSEIQEEKSEPDPVVVEKPEKSEKTVDKNGDEEQTSVVKRKTTSSDGDNNKNHSSGKSKKQKTDEVEKVVVATEVVKEASPPKLPDLERYWKPVQEDSTNFTGWTYLLQYVDQETDAVAARDAYNAFLGHYPYCYGYWRKYADYERTKGDRNKCEEVFERGLKAIPLSVDLWIHYLNYVKTSNAEDEVLIRCQYERALQVCGLEFRSDKLWEAYIKWETEGKRLQRVVGIYDRLLGTPTLGYNSHFGSFSDFVRAHPVKELLDAEQYAAVRKEVVGDETEDIEEAMRKRVIGARKKIHEATVQEVTNRWTFEEAVKRPYFHVKPLERCQLKNWTDYLDYEIECGDRKRIIVLFERCLIACALYEEYWQKFARFLMGDEKKDEDKVDDEEIIKTTRDVFERACLIHHKEKPKLHLMWATFEECHGCVDKAASILESVDKVVPNLLQIEYRRINLERRRGNFEACETLFTKYVAAAKNQNHMASTLAIKHARFVHLIRKDLDRALKILRESQTADPTNVRIPLQMIDLAMQRPAVDDQEVIEIMDRVLAREDLDTEQRVLFAQRKVEFLEDFGKSPRQLQKSPRQLQKSQRELQTALTKLQEEKKAKSLENNDLKQIHSTQTVAATPVPLPQSGPNQYANYSYYGGGGAGGAPDASSYGAYSDANYWNQYGQYAGNNYANYYQ